MEPAFQMKYATRLTRARECVSQSEILRSSPRKSDSPSPTGLVRGTETLARIGVEELCST